MVCPAKARELKERTRELKRVRDEKKTLWGFPIIESDAVPRGTVLIGPLPTWEDVLRYGSLENAIQARAKEWAKINGIDDEILSADEIG